MAFPLEDLQKKLGYTFENIQLLHEALTHDFDSRSPDWDIFNDGNVFYKKRKLQRLKLVGVRVLKLLGAEKAIVAEYNSKTTDFSQEGYLTQICQIFASEIYFQRIADGLQLWKYVQVRNFVNSKQLTIQKEVIQAIYGAVFIDAGGCQSENLDGLNSVQNLFDLLFTKYFSPGKNCYNSSEIFGCFNVSHSDVKTWLFLNGYVELGKIEHYSNLEKNIEYKFSEPNTIKTALTHDSVKGYVKNFTHYEGLEFLGDAVYELVICDYLFWYYINDVDGKFFNFETLRKFVSKQFQIEIANGLELKTFIIKPDHVSVRDTHDFLESIVGAIYIDSRSLSTVRNVLVGLCRKFEKKTVDSCNTRLPFALRTYYGSWHYRQHETLEDKILEEHELPPKRQEVFRIEYYSKLSSQLEKYNKTIKRGWTIQSWDSKARIVGSESWCNQQEFGRVGLYQSWIRMERLPNMEWDYKTRMMRCKNYAYNTFTEYSAECAPISNSEFVTPVSKPVNNYREPTLKDVCNAASLISRWVFIWALLILRSFVKLGINILQIILSLLICIIVLVMCLEYMGFNKEYFAKISKKS